MASFPCLEGLAMAVNSRSLFDRMMLYFKRETSIDLDFAAHLHNLWVQFINRTNDRKLFISELDGLPPSVISYNYCQFLHQVQENDFIKMLELQKMIAETYCEVHKKLDFVSVMKNILPKSFSNIKQPNIPNNATKKIAFPRLQELAATQNSNNVTDAMSVYIERKINDDLHFAAGLSHFWEVLYSRVNEHKLLIVELSVFGVSLALQCAKFFTQLSQTEVLKMLEIRKSIAEIQMIPVRLYLLLYYVHGDDEVKTWVEIFVVLFRHGSCQITKVDPPVGLFVTHIISLFKSDFVSLDPRLQSKKSAMDRSFTLSSTKEADNVKIVQSCNGLLLCSGSGMPVFDYVYNPSTNKYKKFSYPDCSLDNSPYYSSAGLRIAFDPIKSPHYKLVDAGRTFCDIDIQIYSSETNKWSICRILIQMSYLLHLKGKLFEWRGSLFLVCLDDFGSRELVDYVQCLEHFLGEKEQDSFLVIKLSGKVVQYNLISKTLHEIYDCGSNQLDDNHVDNDDDELLQQFQAEHNVYEFIPSFASV
ncbi:hypothetical protein Tco_0407304 [Tanacetum coccineum]